MDLMHVGNAPAEECEEPIRDDQSADVRANQPGAAARAEAARRHVRQDVEDDGAFPFAVPHTVGRHIDEPK